MKRVSGSNTKLLLFFLVSGILLKALTFFFSVIDIDESTYLLIGKEIFKGNWLYVDYYDTKPIGIFLIFGLIDFLTPHAIFSSRLLAAIFVGASAFLLFKLKLRISGNRFASVFAGLAYLILASMYRFTFAANTEIFFVFFTLWAFNIFFSDNGNKKYFLGGLAAGIGFTIKYVVAFDILAFALFLTYIAISGRINVKHYFLAGISILCGLLLPTAIIASVYALAGHFDEFQRFAFSFLLNYQEAHEINNYWEFILDIHLKYLPVFVFFYYFLFKNLKKVKKDPYAFFAVVWVVVTFLSVYLQKKTNTHYTIQVFPVLAFLLADIFIIPNKAGANIRKHTAKFFAWVFGILLLTNMVNQSYYLTRKDIPREIATYIEPKLQADDIVYVPGYKHIIYHLIDQAPPGKYVHPTLFAYKHHKKSLRIDVNKEIKKIMDKKPEFVIFRIDPYMYDHEDYFYKNYIEVKKLTNRVFIYRLK